MPITATCPRCDTTITASDEDDLVHQVQAHARTEHGMTRELPRKHVLAMLRKRASAQPRISTDS
jgi:hypothetical protein